MSTKKQASTLLILMVAVLTGLASSQATARTVMTAQVPFDFVVNGKTIPAGQCVIRTLSNALTVLSIGSENQKELVFPIEDQSPKASKATALVFHRYGHRYFLAAVERAGKSGYQLRPTKMEEELRAQNVAEQELTLLASAN